MRSYLNFLGFVLALLVWIACQPTEKTDGQTADTASVAATQQELTAEDIAKVTAHFPSPVDFVSYINHANLAYNGQWLNPIGQVSSYLGRPEWAALNLGVYMADLGYQSLYMRSEAALQYLKTAKQLSDQLNILNEKTNEYLRRFEQNLSNRDSLLTITREAYYSIEDYLRENDKRDLAALIVTGAWVEGLYGGGTILTSQANFFNNEKYRPLIYRIGAQKNSLSNIIAMLEKIEDVEEVNKLVQELKQLQQYYQQVEVVEAKAGEEAVVDIAEVQNIEELVDRVVINSVKEVHLEESTFLAINQQIARIRQMIVRP